MAFDTAAFQGYAAERGQVRATTDNHQHDVRAVDVDKPDMQEYIRRRAGVEAAWYLNGFDNFAAADREEAERVFVEAFVAAYEATMPRLSYRWFQNRGGTC